MASELVLVRFSGDISTKARETRRRFLKRLARNLRDVLSASAGPGRVFRTHNRLFVETEGPAPLDALARVFGVQSLARVERRSYADVNDLVEAGVALFRERVRGRRFAIRARRVGERERIPVTAQQVERQLGAALLSGAAGVDLSHPEVTVHVELGPNEAFFFGELLPGPGGLPLGVEGRAVALVSGGFDSAVAAWQMMKRGVSLDYVFCNLGGRSHQLGTLRVMKVIADDWSYGARPRFYAVDFDPIAQELRDRTEKRYWQILLKRSMLRAAEHMGRERESLAIVTGEAVGQVSSQTLQNLAVISEGARLPILRPLVGFNKDEILAIARRIGTYDLSKVVGEYCAMVPRKPATAATQAAIQRGELRRDPELLDSLLAQRSEFDLRALDLEKLDRVELQVDEVGEDAIVVDLRSKAAFQSWHYPGALFLDFANALRSYPSFDRAKRYVLYCEFGLKSAHLAELMLAEGFEARHFSGGLEGVLRYAREGGIATPELI